MQKQLDHIRKRYTEIEQELQKEGVSSDPQKLRRLTSEQAELSETVELIDKLTKTEQDIKETTALINDQEMRAIAEEDLIRLKEDKKKLEESLQQALVPKDPNDNKNVIAEIRAGAGGDEAGLFASDLFRMYSRLAESKNYRINIMSANRTGIGGFKEIIFSIKGRDVYKNLKYESGVHRVQRIPDTEKMGRVHTSTVTVAIMPEAAAVDIDINPEDLRIDTFRASGHGGQSVNKTESAVRITYLPTKTVVSCQDEKSQLKNREKALKILRARILADKMSKAQQKEADLRRSQVGTGDRSEKIRTYNYPQSRVTDHRIGYSTKNLAGIMEGRLNELIATLIKEDEKRKLEQLDV